MKQRKKKSSLHFSGKRMSGLGNGALVIGIAAWLIFLALSVCSATTNGEAGWSVGVIGILDAVFSVIGTVSAYRALQERDISYVVPVIALVLNAMLFILYLSLYFMGIAIR